MVSARSLLHPVNNFTGLEFYFPKLASLVLTTFDSGQILKRSHVRLWLAAFFCVIIDVAHRHCHWLGKEEGMPLPYHTLLPCRTFLALLLVTGCAPEIRTPKSTALNWTAENPLVSTGVSEGSNAVSRVLSPSSLEALRRGESTSTPPSSPLTDIYFAFDRYDLRVDARETLDANAKWLKENPSVRVEIEGHCDERGTSEYNLGLAAKRAQAARDYLVSVGIVGLDYPQ